MKNYELIGLICVAAIENNIAMTTEQIANMAGYLTDKGVKVGDREIIINKPIAKVKPVVDNPVEELGVSKKNQEKLRHADVDDILKKPVVQTDIDKRMDDAYLGEHPNIQPDPIEKKPLSPREKQLWDYMQAHPDARMPSICTTLGITQGNYYMLKVQLKKKGWIVSAVENVQEIKD